MVGTLLTKEMIEAGAKLIEKLDKRGVKPDAAVWLYSTDAERWRLYLSAASISKIGPRESYRKIQQVLRESPNEFRELDLDDISVAGPDASKIAILRTAVRTGPGIHGIRLTNNAFNGTLIEDAHIYRIS
jgi:hypothetical protein